jgi:urea transport system substrate-binding protein
MARWLLVFFTLIVVGVAAWVLPSFLGDAERPIRIGLLHSRTGALAISELSMIDAEVLALEELNQAGGILGRRLEWVIADGRSDPRVFAREAERLIDQEHVAVIIGCWASAARKSVQPIVESKDHLLIYPNAYEGLEQSPNIIYTGAAPNQQIIPAINWCVQILKARAFFVVGSDYLWPRCVTEIVRDQLKALGAEIRGERYIPLGSTGLEVGQAVAAIQQTQPDVIISTVAGDTNKVFYQELARAGVRPERTPVIAFGVAEEEIRSLPIETMVGDYSAWNYFQSVDHPTNVEFVQRFQKRFGPDRVTSDPIVASYNGVRLWAQAVEEAGTVAVTEVRKALLAQSLKGPEGIISIDRETQHTWRPFFLGRIRGDGQFEIVWRLEKPIRPVPYPGSRKRREWDDFVKTLYQSWNGNWFNPGTRTTP